MNLGQVKAKARKAVARREDEIEQDEIEGGEINLIPYLDIVTNLMLFLLAGISAGLIMGQLNTTLPDKGPSQAAMNDQDPDKDPDDKPLKMVVSVTESKILVWSISGLEGTLDTKGGKPGPKAIIERSGDVGTACFSDYQCEFSYCKRDYSTDDPGTCEIPEGKPSEIPPPIPVFDYEALNQALYEIAERRWKGAIRKPETFKIILMADGSIPYGTVITVMDTLRCKLPGPKETGQVCQLPSDDEEVLSAPEPVMEKLAPRYDWKRKEYDPETDALFHDIMFSTGFE